MSQTAYLMSCEVVCGEGSDGALEGMEDAHLIVGVYATSEAEAMAKIEASFDEEGYALFVTEWIAPAADMEWEDADAAAEAADLLARLASIPDEVVYGPLYAVQEEIEEAA